MAKKSTKNNGKKQKKNKNDEQKGNPKKQNKCLEGLVVSLKGNLKMTLSSIPLRQHREKRAGRPAGGKRLAIKEMPGKLRSAYRRSLDPCDNSNDSGLGFDHHTDTRPMGIADRLGWPSSEAKRPKIDIKVENDDDNDGYSFPDTIGSSKENVSLIRAGSTSESIPSLGLSNNQHSSTGRAAPRCVPAGLKHSGPSATTLTCPLTSSSEISEASLTIVKQPEQQHRARYQTEGSRGAVKDREGNGFPVVRLNGYYKPALLQVFIGTDVGKVSPHMFYQACKVSGKNSTPCVEKKIDGTCVIELQLDPSKDMSATCDCVGILKERNVDVEHRFPEQLGNRSKKKSTRCRMIFRTTIMHDDGTNEMLQVCSQPIVCTQPPGVPEICKKSLTSCPAGGGLELFVLGKNFSKDTKVYFQQVDEDRLITWEQACVPDKEYLQQTHFVCVVPPYRRSNITEPVSVRLFVVASGKTSESHQFVYTPLNGVISSVASEAASQSQQQQSPFFNKMLWSASSISKREQDLSIMPPPETNMVPLSTRRTSLSLPQSTEVHSPPLHNMKQEYFDDNSQNSVMDSNEIHQERYRHVSESSLDVHHGDSNMSMINENSMDVIQHGTSMTSSDLLHHDNSSMSSLNENSVEMIVRRNSMSRSLNGIRENSVDVNMSNSNISILNEDSSCSNAMHHSSHLLMQRQKMVGAPQTSKDVEDLKVIDLRMKMPMATVADLASTCAPSMATLQNFGVTDATSGPLLAQSAQSVESFLTKIECKTANSNPLMENLSFKDRMTTSLLGSQSSPMVVQTGGSEHNMNRLPERVFLNADRAFVMENNASNAPLNMFPKTDAAEGQNKAMLPSTSSTSFNADKLDAFLNSTADHIINNSPPRSEPVKYNLNQPNILLSPQSSLMAPSVPVLNPQISPSSDGSATSVRSNLSPEVILNSQVSPTMICQPSPNALPQDSILPSENLCAPRIANNLMQNAVSPQAIMMHNSPPTLNTLSPPMPQQLTLADPEKAVLLEATVDLLQTQKKLSELECLRSENKEPILNKLYMNNYMGITNGAANNAQVNSPPSMALASNGGDKSEFIIPISVKEMQMDTATHTTSTVEKKIEDRMIPQSFTSLTENELINFINPSCFDQGNNNYA